MSKQIVQEVQPRVIVAGGDVVAFTIHNQRKYYFNSTVIAA
jgi:hypothetical protein